MKNHEDPWTPSLVLYGDMERIRSQRAPIEKIPKGETAQVYPLRRNDSQGCFLLKQSEGSEADYTDVGQMVVLAPTHSYS